MTPIIRPRPINKRSCTVDADGPVAVSHGFNVASVPTGRYLSVPDGSPPVVPHPSAAIAAGPITVEQMAQLQRAKAAYRPVRRAAAVARSSAITTLVIALGTAAYGLFSSDLSGLIAAGLLGAIGAVEFLGHLRLLRADGSAPRLLMRNQLAFLALIALYCIARMITFSADALKNETLPPDIRAQLAPMPEIARTIDQNVDRYGPLAYRGFYALVLLLSIAFQGGLAWYYARRTSHIRTYNAAAPPWVRQLLWKLRG